MSTQREHDARAPVRGRGHGDRGERRAGVVHAVRLEHHCSCQEPGAADGAGGGGGDGDTARPVPSDGGGGAVPIGGAAAA